MRKLEGSLLVLASVFLYGSYGLWSALLGSEFGDFYQAYVRAFIVLLVLIPMNLVARRWKKIARHDRKLFLLVCGLVIFTQAPMYYSYQHAGVGIANTIFFSTFLIAQYVFGWLWFHERLGIVKLVSLLLALAGLFLTFGGALRGATVLALAMAVIGGAGSGAQTASTKFIPKDYSPLQISVYTWTTSLLMHLPISFVLGERQLLPHFDLVWLWMLLFALAGVGSFLLIIRAYRYIDPSVGGLIGLLEVVIAICLGAIFLNEHVKLSTVAGACLILLAAFLPHVKDLDRRDDKVTRGSV